MNLRKKVGHEPIINTGSSILVFNDKKEILLTLRNDTNNWGIPSGGKELNETLEECAIRELKEETNLNTSNLELLTILSGKEYFFTYPNGDQVDRVIALYKVKNYSGNLNTNDNENKKLKFFSLDNLPNMEPSTKIITSKIKNQEIKL